MPDKEKVALDFGIEDTIDAGDTEALGAFFGNTNPDDIQENEEKTNSSTTDKSTTKPIATTKPDNKEKKEDETPKGPTEEELRNAVLENEEKEGGEKGKSGNDAEEEGSSAKTTMASLAEEFQNLGIFGKEEGEDGKEIGVDPNLTPQEFLKMYEVNQKKALNEAVENFLGQFGDDYREMFDAVFVNGVDPKEYLNTFTKLSDISTLDMTKEPDAEKVYREYFRRQGFPEDKIEAKVQKAKTNGDLEDDSTEFQKILIEQDAKTLENITKEKEQKTQNEKRSKQLLLQNVNKTLSEKLKEKEYDGIPLTDQIALSARDFLTTEKYKLKTGETITEFDRQILELKRPENHALLVKVGLLLMNKMDLSKIKIKEKNDATTKSFEWATKGRGITTPSNNKKGASQTKEETPFI